METMFGLGIDVGSTTVKMVLIDGRGRILFSRYERHRSDPKAAFAAMLEAAAPELSSLSLSGSVRVAVTGSAGLGLAEHSGLPFVQEVIAAGKAVETLIPGTDVAIELGGEDAKITYFTNGVEQRMNGTCAGGTGAFIDQMASLLNTDSRGLDELASRSTAIYPIAARCGVFAKADVQPLVNEGARREDIAASILQAVVNQTISGLACGRPIKGKIAFLGGPLHFSPMLRRRFVETLALSAENAVCPPDAQLFVATGAALLSLEGEEAPTDIADIVAATKREASAPGEVARLRPLFADKGAKAAFDARHGAEAARRGELSAYSGPCWLGVDAGSTTTKLALIGDSGEILHSFYMNNGGNPIALALEALRETYSLMPDGAWIGRACATGYGESMLKAAFGIDDGEVETIAHCAAAQAFAPGVESVVDIGGQDMKFIRVKDGIVESILLNEACSSGCGSFIETFAHSLGHSAKSFTEAALGAASPVDLGSRCTVFMNSRVKQAQKEGATVADIAAGLAYSVIRNALQKVIKLRSPNDLGATVVAQGGTFSSDAILRAFETISGRHAVRPDISGLMGAYGAALIARKRWREGARSAMIGEDRFRDFAWSSSHLHCPGCQNSCQLTVNDFGDGRRLVSGNRCERGEALSLEAGAPAAGAPPTEGSHDAACRESGTHDGSSSAKRSKKRAGIELPELYSWKYERVFRYLPRAKADAPNGEVGIPRVLNMFENYPLWFTVFDRLGFRVVLSPRSSKALYEKGMDTIPSESVCYPGKLVHGHVKALLDRGTPFVFYPCAPYEKAFVEGANNHFNCPIVTSYPEVILNNVDEFRHGSTLYRNPFVPIDSLEGLARAMEEEFSLECYAKAGIRVPRAAVRAAVEAGFAEQSAFQDEVRAQGERALDAIEKYGLHGIVLAGRPYHVDPEIHHGIPALIQSLGMAVLTEDSVAHLGTPPRPLRVVDQWSYHSRLYAAAAFAASRADLDVVQLNSFGCGLDAVTTDQVDEILQASGRVYTCIKIDEQSNLGAARIRLRSLATAIDERRDSGRRPFPPEAPKPRPVFLESMRAGYTILAPQMSPIHFRIIESAFRRSGYNLVIPETDASTSPESLFEHPVHVETDEGLRSVNNDACYPSILVIGQLLVALKSGKYDLSKTALLITQTGGGCRATNYIAFIRKAIDDAGFGHVPVISLNASGIERNPGFRITPSLAIRSIMALVYGDILMRVLYRTRPYEKVPGSADALCAEWSERCAATLERPSFPRYARVIRDMIGAFDTLALAGERKPRIGVVGEILVKFHPTANNRIVDVIEDEGAEAVMPDLADFFFYSAFGNQYRHEKLHGPLKASLVSKAAIWALELFRGPQKKWLARSARFSPPASIYALAKGVDGIVQLGNMTGEGWFLTAEMVELIHSGVDGIACVQPFACLPNHVTGKGMIKELRHRYPQVAVAAIDYDPGASEVNQMNRIKLLLSAAKTNFRKKKADIMPAMGEAHEH